MWQQPVLLSVILSQDLQSVSHCVYVSACRCVCARMMQAFHESSCKVKVIQQLSIWSSFPAVSFTLVRFFQCFQSHLIVPARSCVCVCVCAFQCVCQAWARSWACSVMRADSASAAEPQTCLLHWRYMGWLDIWTLFETHRHTYTDTLSVYVCMLVHTNQHP